jgi:hypothetical protein
VIPKRILKGSEKKMAMDLKKDSNLGTAKERHLGRGKHSD